MIFTSRTLQQVTRAPTVGVGWVLGAPCTLRAGGGSLRGRPGHGQRQLESAPIGLELLGERYLTENPYGNFDCKILLKISLIRFRIIGSVLSCFGDNHPRQVRSWFTALSSSQFRSVGMGDFGFASIASHSFTVMILKTSHQSSGSAIHLDRTSNVRTGPRQ
jgi:hypothetical protein